MYGPVDDVCVCLFLCSTLSRMSKTTTTGTSEAVPASEVRASELFCPCVSLYFIVVVATVLLLLLWALLLLAAASKMIRNLNDGICMAKSTLCPSYKDNYW